MEIVKTGEHEHILLNKNDKCPICDGELTGFSWRIFHGEAESSCCGAIYQIKDYYIDNPTEDQKKLLSMLAGEYIELKIKKEWVEPLKETLNKTGQHSINDDGVIDTAKEIVNNNRKAIK